MIMEKIISSLEMSIEEYKSIMFSVVPAKEHKSEDYWIKIRDTLHVDGGWTIGGAEHISNLARNYGIFVLRNALALAIALDIEDGDFNL